ncbi:MAG: hypothetical protein LUH58_06275 [Lachnospiraceae bacterium]|nr:hypothetical protein [Lachnospiraceae bacterium]
MGNGSGISVKDIALIGIMIATIEVVKDALAFLPNVELVTLLIVLYTLFFGKRILFAIPVFVLLQGLLHGFGLWWIMYLYVWPLLAVLTFLFRKQTSLLFWSAFCGLFGLFFGALCSLPYLILSGPAAALAWWVAGIPFDLIHCISNAVLCFVLFKPLHLALNKLKNAWF